VLNVGNWAYGPDPLGPLRTPLSMYIDQIDYMFYKLPFISVSCRAGKKILFAATTVPLAHQQGKYLQDHIGGGTDSSDSHVKIITGDMSPEDWDGSKWKKILSQFQVN